MIRPTRRLATRTRLLAATLATAFVIAAPLASADRPVGGTHAQFIVRFKDGTPEHGNAAQRQHRLDAIGHAQGLHLGQLRRLAVGADVIRSDRPLGEAATRALLDTLRGDPRVAYAGIDARVFPAYTPDDPLYANQWHYFEPTAGIDVPAAWDVTRGEGEVVAVLDTGITWHPDLAGNVLPGYDFIADAAVANDGDGRDANPGDQGDYTYNGQCSPTWTARPSSWHGTHVTGTVAAVSGNALGVAGVAHGAKVQPVRVLGRCGGYTSDIDDAIVWASGGSVAGIADNPTPASVINLSLGGSGACLASTQAAIDVAVANGATVVVAAGNNNADASGYQPASCNNVITVGAVGRTGARASYSNFGAVVDIAAPGGDGSDYVRSTINTGTTFPAEPWYAGYQGTSMAAPHVAGVAALMQAASGGTLAPAQVQSLIEATARPLPVACPEGCGVGLLDAAAAVAAGAEPVLVQLDPAAVAEGDVGTHELMFRVKLMKPVAEDVVFDIATVDGSASSGTDYLARSESAQVIPAGATEYAFAVTVQGDAFVEEDEDFSVALANVSGPVTVVKGVAAGVIANDDPVPLTVNVPVTVSDDTAGHVRYFVLDVPTRAENLMFQFAGGDAMVRARHQDSTSDDCSGPQSCVPFATKAGRWLVTVQASAPYAGATLKGSYTLRPALSISDATLVEGDGPTAKKMAFTVSLAETNSQAVEFYVSASNGTASMGSDFVPPAGPFQVPAGQLSKAIFVDITGDTTVEPDEQFTLEIFPSGNSLGTDVLDGTGIGTIVDDDTPSLSIGDAMITEGDAGTKTLTFMARLSKVATFPVTYDIATSDLTAIAGEDYEAATLTGRTIPAGQLAQSFSVTLYGDTVLEDNEFFYATLANASVPVSDGQAFGIIHNDEGPTLSINDFGYQEGNSGLKTMTFTVSLSQVSAVPVTFTIGTGGGTAVGGIDYTAIAPRTATIPAGQLSKQFLVTTQGDTAIEGNEAFFVSLSNASVSLTDSQGKGSIINDDGPTLSIGDASAREVEGMMTFTVSLSQAMAKPATFTVSTSNGTAVAGSDYRAVYPTELSIPAGQLSMTYNVMLTVDHFSETTETFQLNLALGNVSIVDGVGVGRIRP